MMTSLAHIRRTAVVVVLSAVAILAALLAPFPMPIKGWLRGDREETPTELVEERRA